MHPRSSSYQSHLVCAEGRREDVAALPPIVPKRSDKWILLSSIHFNSY